MDLWIVRHGKAEQESPDGTDFSRPLRSRGERQAAFLAELFLSDSDRADAGLGIMASRAIRAARTAEIIGDRLGVTVQYDDALLVDEPAGPVVDRIESWAEGVPSGAGLMIVGHNPQLSRLASVLSGANVGLRTGEAALIGADPGDLLASGRLRAMYRLED